MQTRSAWLASCLSVALLTMTAKAHAGQCPTPPLNTGTTLSATEGTNQLVTVPQTPPTGMIFVWDLDGDGIFETRQTANTIAYNARMIDGAMMRSAKVRTLSTSNQCEPSPAMVVPIAINDVPPRIVQRWLPPVVVGVPYARPIAARDPGPVDATTLTVNAASPLPPGMMMSNNQLVGTASGLTRVVPVSFNATAGGMTSPNQQIPLLIYGGLGCQDNDGDSFVTCEGGFLSMLTGSTAILPSLDCVDSNSMVNPGAVEEPCDNVDNNCNGMTDEGEPSCPGLGPLCAPIASGPNRCLSCPVVMAVADTCDGLDNDCDGAVDEDCCVAGEPCFLPQTPGNPPCNGSLVCTNGMKRCAALREICNGVDDDCNGLTDDSSCSTGSYCVANGTGTGMCIPGCGSDSDCPAGASCNQHVCSRPDAGLPDVPNPTDVTVLPDVTPIDDGGVVPPEDIAVPDAFVDDVSDNDASSLDAGPDGGMQYKLRGAGCNCSVPARSSSPNHALIAIVLGATLAVFRRRRVLSQSTTDSMS